MTPDPIPAALERLIDALHQQAAAIDRLAESSQMLVEAMAAAEDCEPDEVEGFYMDGSPIRVSA